MMTVPVAPQVLFPKQLYESEGEVIELVLIKHYLAQIPTKYSPGKFPSFSEAARTAALILSSASAGTVDKNPIRGGSWEGYVKFP
jgi:hypothetical protein